MNRIMSGSLFRSAKRAPKSGLAIDGIVNQQTLDQITEKAPHLVEVTVEVTLSTRAHDPKTMALGTIAPETVKSKSLDKTGHNLINSPAPEIKNPNQTDFVVRLSKSSPLLADDPLLAEDLEYGVNCILSRIETSAAVKGGTYVYNPDAVLNLTNSENEQRWREFCDSLLDFMVVLFGVKHTKQGKASIPSDLSEMIESAYELIRNSYEETMGLTLPEERTRLAGKGIGAMNAIPKLLARLLTAINLSEIRILPTRPLSGRDLGVLMKAYSVANLVAPAGGGAHI